MPKPNGDIMIGATIARSHNPVHHELKNILGSLRSTETPSGILTQSVLPEWPFVTLSRQGGTGAVRVGKLLAAHLNELQPNLEYPWQCLDRELVQRIAADHHLSTELIESLETSSHTWISEFFEGLRLTDRASPSELAVLRRVTQTMRGLARAGHVILVGLAGVMMTRDMPRAVHVRIIAPLEWRVRKMAQGEGISEKAARQRVRSLDQNRQAFFAKYWPHARLNAELFHITFNAAMMSEEMMAQSLVSLLTPAREEAGNKRIMV